MTVDELLDGQVTRVSYGSGAVLAGILVVLVGGILAVSSNARAQSWKEGACVESKESASFETEPPQAYMMLDRSGSMDFCTWGANHCDGYFERWNTAVRSIKSAARSMLATDPPQVELGLGMFADSICADTEPIEYCWEFDVLFGTIDICLTVSEGGRACGSVGGYRACTHVSRDLVCVWEPTNNYVSPGDLQTVGSSNNIARALDGESPSGGTPMSAAIRKSAEELRGGDTSRDQAGILINDGAPSGEHDEVIEAACDHHDPYWEKGIDLYTVGLGSGTNQMVNHAIAAAGGTGKCCQSGTDCKVDGSGYVDICAKARYGYLPDYFTDYRGDWELGFTCTGAYQAYGQTGLSEAISDITNKLTCSIDVSSWGSSYGQNDWSKPWYDCTPETQSDGTKVAYDCFSIEMPYPDYSSDYDRDVLYHKESSQATDDWHWEWASSAQDKIVLSDQACEHVSGTWSQTVDVSLACMCGSRPVDNQRSAVAGTEVRTCTISNPGTCQCSRGRATCSQGFNKCEQFEAISVNDWNASDDWDKCRAPRELAGLGETCSPCGEEGPIKCSKQRVDQCQEAIENPPPTTRSCQTGLPGRCSVGARYCSADGWSNCQQVYQPVPEICNGLDDDCDGKVDNIRQSWQKDWGFGLDQLDEMYGARACGGRHACTCLGSGATKAAHRGESTPMMSTREEFKRMVQKTQTSCYCSE